MNEALRNDVDDMSRLATLRLTPTISWPVVSILVFSLTAMMVAWWQILHGAWPVWVGIVVNSVAGYALFTPAHDAIHRAAASNERLNDFILSAATFVAVPFGRGKLFRLLHMQHHRFTNEERDPDHWLASSLKTMPLWGIWPFIYLYKFLRNPALLPNLEVSEVRRELLVAAVVLGLLFAWQPWYMLMLWLLPTYFAFFLMCLVFMVLPHYPHTGRQDVDPNTTALMRMGQEWLLTPALMYQNYHLVHHLYPTIPFYRYGLAWKAREAYHRKHSASVIVGPFQLGQRNSA